MLTAKPSRIIDPTILEPLDKQAGRLYEAGD